jgi:broad specificity phosphatase PhoE
MKKIRIKRESGKTYLYIVRHAHFNIPKEGNDPHPPISKKGRVQARALAKRFLPLKDTVEVFYCSSMKRAIQTAEEVKKVIRKTPKHHDGLWEFNKILWTNRYYHYKYWKHWRKHNLTISALNGILKSHRGKVILIVAHGNVIKGILRNKARVPASTLRKLEYKHCHITFMKFDGTRLEKTYCINSKMPPSFG